MNIYQKLKALVVIKNSLIVLFLAIGTFAFSQEEDSREMYPSDSMLRITPTTRSEIYPKKMKDNFQKKYQNDEFNYNIVKPRQPVWQNFVNRLSRWIDKYLGVPDAWKTQKYTVLVLKIFAIVVISVILFLLLKYIFLGKGNSFLSKKRRKINPYDEDLIENVHELNFPELIAKAEQKGDYRTAVRYLYLQMLKQLTDKKIIDWTPEKTNRDYAKEIQNNQLRDAFRRQSYIFDYVWYGEFQISSNTYTEYKDTFQSR